MANKKHHEVTDKSKENLKPFNKITKEEQRKKASMGGKASGKVRAEKKTMKQMLDYLLEKEITNSKGETASTLEAISISIIKKAMGGDVRAYEVIRDTIGQKQAEVVKLQRNEPVDIEELKKLKAEIEMDE